MNTVIFIDHSGSMSEQQIELANKLTCERASHIDDLVTVLAFDARDPQVLYGPSPGTEIQPSVIKCVDQDRFRGGSNPGPAVEWATEKYGPCRKILVSDLYMLDSDLALFDEKIRVADGCETDITQPAHCGDCTTVA